MHLNATKAAVLLSATLIFWTGCDTSSTPPEETGGDPQQVAALDAGQPIPGQYIVVLKDRSSYAGKTVEQVIGEMASSDGVSVNHRYSSALSGFSGKFSIDAIERIRQSPYVDYVEPDRIVTLPPFTIEGGKAGRNPKGGGGSTSEPGQETPWGIARVGGSDNGANNKTAWIIDTGVDLDHPDLNVDVSRSASMLSGRQSNNPDDQNGHGTHVAGTIAAIDNEIGVVGVAAGAKVVSVRVLDSRGSGWLSDVIEGVDYVAANGNDGDVANMSLGGGISPSLDTAVLNASTVVTFALAAGNESDDASNHSPARVGLNNGDIHTVSAMDSGDNFAYFSNYGAAVDWAAPGMSILSLWKGGGTNTISGTSMAAPHVAGILLLGGIITSGTVNGDPDGHPDPIAHR